MIRRKLNHGKLKLRISEKWYASSPEKTQHFDGYVYYMLLFYRPAQATPRERLLLYVYLANLRTLSAVFKLLDLLIL